MEACGRSWGGGGGGGGGVLMHVSLGRTESPLDGPVDGILSSVWL